MTDSNFYLGRAYDPVKQTVTEQQMNYDSADLTTHAVVTGMTGSGKTGLCITLLEEAALKGIPAIIIDPKGDLTNLLLHFPDLAPQDFQPWIDTEQVRRSGKTLEQASLETSLNWQNGLKEWGITQERLLALKNSAQFGIFTPGSDSGIPVSVLSSLAVPGLSWAENREALREKISSTVTALLGLVGYDDIDPLRSREHILLANLFETAWSKGRDVELTELILQTQTPPFDKLGAFSVDTFFPAKDRMELAMDLNNILASPAFEAWREGQSLDIGSMLYTSDGRPRHNIFYLAHLSDTERMFFVTLLLSAVETWMRTQKGATSLRALLYMDEIFGYLPPQRNPASKQPLLRMLKQARAFGLGLLLATQNPVDVDYKALSNAGTWFIGKLQTEQDKDRLLDGLESAAGGVTRNVFDKLISSLGKRVFVLHNVHAKQPVLLQSRWTMNYLAGPLTRTQIPALNKLANADAAIQTLPKTASVSMDDSPSKSDQPSLISSTIKTLSIEGSLTKPPVPSGVKEYFLPQNLSLPEAFKAAGQTMSPETTLAGVVYRPALIASAQVRILDRKLGVDSERTRAALVESLDKGGIVRWDEHLFNSQMLEQTETSPAPSSRFGTIDAPLTDPKLFSTLQKDFADWVFRNSSVQARANDALKVYAGPDVNRAEFMKACADAASQKRDAEIEKESAKFDRQLQTLENKKSREERELKMDQQDLEGRKREANSNLLEIGASVIGIGRKRSITSQFSKNRLTNKARADVEESIDAIKEFDKQIAEIQKLREEAIAEIKDRWGHVVNDITEVTVTPKKTDVFVDLFGIAWRPCYVVRSGEGTIEVPAFGEE